MGPEDILPQDSAEEILTDHIVVGAVRGSAGGYRTHRGIRAWSSSVCPDQDCESRDKGRVTSQVFSR